MLKGAQKNMIVVRTRDSRLFEEAYFVMRRNATATSADESDMLWEANRILESSVAGGRGDGVKSSRVPLPGQGLLRGLVWFFLGFLTGGGAVGLLWVLL